MEMLIRLLAVLMLISPLFTSGCVEVLDPEDRPGGDEEVIADSPTAEEVDEASAEEEAFETFDDDEFHALNQQMEAEEELGLQQSEVPGEEEETRQQEDEVESISPDEVRTAGALVVDEDAPRLGIEALVVEEGDESKYLSVLCHDPQVSQSWWHSDVRRRFSRRCDVDLATAARAVSIEPEVDFRIAPTPRGFRIMVDFEQGEYEVTIAAGLRSEKGSNLRYDHETTLEIGELSQALAFEADGHYLPRRGWGELGFRHRNVDRVRLSVRHIPVDNLAFWLADGSGDADERTSTQVIDTEIAVRNEADEMLRSSLNIEERLGDAKPGLYQIEIASDDAEAKSRVQVTDINLITKRHETPPGEPWEEHIDVWAVGMESTKPVRRAEVTLIQPSGTELASCRTDRAGHCRLDLPEPYADTTAPMAILARKGDDLTYLKFDDVRIETGVDNVDGPDFLEEFSYLATLYGDRDLYRPGDEAHIFGALRDDDYTAAEPGIPVELTVTDPQNNVVVERTLETGRTGTFDLSFGIDPVAPTGRWYAELEVGTRTLETYAFHVEEFVPERLEVGLEPVRPVFTAGEQARFEVSARYLFGASARGSEVELECRLVPIDSPRDGRNGWSYGPVEIEERRRLMELGTRRGVIGEDDTVELSCPRPNSTPGGPMRVQANVAVAEGGSGRTTFGAADAVMHPSTVELGLRSDADDLEAGESLRVEGRIDNVEGFEFDGDKDRVTLEFYNVRRQRSWRWQNGRYQMNDDFQLVLERVMDVEIEDGGFEATNIVAGVHTAYLVRARYGDARTDLKIDRRGRGWNWSAQRDTTPRPRRPSEINIDVPDQARIGEATPVEFTAPFAGRALVTVETDRVIEQRWVDAREGRNQWSFSVDGDEPNVYVAVFIIRDPREAMEDAFTPERAFGSASVSVEPAEIDARVSLQAPEEVRPGEVLEVEVSAPGVTGPATATIAAVDEGILSLTNYATPDPLREFWRPRSPGVETFDTVGWATQLPPMAIQSRTGGGAGTPEEEAAAGRILPFEPVALWSGPVELGSDGRATVSFDVPNYRGRLRVMSSVFGTTTMGADELDVLVRDPLTVQTTFPRHLTDEDEARIPVFLTNLTDSTRQIEVEIGAEPLEVRHVAAAADVDLGRPVLIFEEGTTQTVELAPDESTTMYFSARATRPSGGAEVTVEARSGEHHSKDRGNIPFRPRGELERIVQTVELEEGIVELASHLDGWIPGSEETTIFASALSEPEAFDNLDQLVRYPHGCAEQTLSRARPLVFLPELVEGIDPQLASKHGDLGDKVDAGISRILSMQASSGGFRYWPGSRGRVYPWVTANAVHFLMDASDRGHSVPRSRIDDAVQWLADNVDSSRNHAYQHYVLAMAGEAQTAKIRDAINDLPSNPSGQDLESAYLLKAALYLAGDRSFADDLLNPQYEDEPYGRTTGWRFYSHRRQRAMILSVFVELFGTDSRGAQLAHAVTQDLKDARHPTTQESVWAVMALGAWYDSEGLDEVQVALNVNGNRVHTQNGNGNFQSWAVHRASELDDLSLDVKTGEFDGYLTAMIRSRGVRRSPTVETGGEGLSLRRTFRNRDGDEIPTDEISPGDVVYVQIELKSETNRSLNNLALVEQLPAGLEVENPDLGAAELPEWATSDGWETDHVNVRDDRVEIYGGLSRRQKVTAVVPTRATISGDFYAPGTHVEAMYDPRIWAREEPTQVRVGAQVGELVD